MVYAYVGLYFGGRLISLVSYYAHSISLRRFSRHVGVFYGGRQLRLPAPSPPTHRRTARGRFAALVTAALARRGIGVSSAFVYAVLLCAALPLALSLAMLAGRTYPHPQPRPLVGGGESPLLASRLRVAFPCLPPSAYMPPCMQNPRPPAAFSGSRLK